MMFTWDKLIEYAGAILALLYLLSAIRESVWCWFAAIVSSAVYAVVFWEAELYLDAALQLIFIGTAVYGYRQWKKINALPEVDKSTPAPDTLSRIVFMTQRETFQFIIVCTAASIVFGWGAFTITHSLTSYLDSFVTCFSIGTTFLVAKKYIENWLYWIVIDLVGAGLYLYKSLYITSGLYILYTALAWVGFKEWRKVAATSHQ